MTLNEDDREGSSFSFPRVADSIETSPSFFAGLLLASRLLILLSGKDWNETFRIACSCSLFFAFFARRSVVIVSGEGPKIGVRVFFYEVRDKYKVLTSHATMPAAATWLTRP